MKHFLSLKKIALFAILFAIIFFIFLRLFSSLLTPTAYSAVFLSNGQVYFGQITHLDTNSIVLKNVYYFRTDTNLSTTLLKEKKDSVDLHVSLVKLGNEIHEPKDAMYINRQHVLFWEDLQDDGKLVQTLKKYKTL